MEDVNRADGIAPLELKKKRKAVKKMKRMQIRTFLNLDNIGGDAYISAKFEERLNSDYCYVLSIRDCSDVITLHGSLSDKKDIANFRHKMLTIRGVCEEMLEHLDKHLPTEGGSK